jgi:hypothetical protein
MARVHGHDACRRDERIACQVRRLPVVGGHAKVLEPPWVGRRRAERETWPRACLRAERAPQQFDMVALVLHHDLGELEELTA